MNRKVIRVIAAVTLIGVMAVPFSVTANCKTRKSSNTVQNHRLAYTYALPVSAASNNGNILGVDMGNLQPQKVKIGGSIISVQGFNFGNHYLATGTSINGPALPYSRVSTVVPAIKSVMANGATSLGYVPGDAFDLEIGQFMNMIGYSYGSRLGSAMNYEITVRPVAGYNARMMVLLPDGTFRELNDSEFDRSLSTLMFVDGTQLFTLHTVFPKAIYMLVYVPQ